jgi:hypothetical protein
MSALRQSRGRLNPRRTKGVHAKCDFSTHLLVVVGTMSKASPSLS